MNLGEPEMHTSLKEHASQPVPDWKPAIHEIVAQADKMRRADTAEQVAASGLLRAAAHLAQSAFDRPKEMASGMKQVRRAQNRLESLLYEDDF